METVHTYLGQEEKVLLAGTPLDVLDMHNLMNKCCFIITDSGGLQEEAPAMNKPVLVLRNNTERPEGLKTGALKLVGTDIDVIYDNACKLLNDKVTYERMANAVNPYGDGKASERIAAALLYEYGIVSERPQDFME